jgi:hypothetical protein
MLNQTQFYWATNSKIIESFGQLFTNIHIVRYPNNGNSGIPTKTIKVPFRYADGEKSVIINAEKVEPQTTTRTKISLPRMSMQMTNFQYDAERKLNTLGKTRKPNPNDVVTFLKNLNPVPYDMSMELSIMTKFEADALQIIEQILPNFAPSFTLNVITIPELQIVKDIPVIIGSITRESNFENVPEENRVVIWKINFICKSYLFPVINDAAIIKQIHITLYPTEAMASPDTASIAITLDPPNAASTDSYTIITDIEEP